MGYYLLSLLGRSVDNKELASSCLLVLQEKCVNVGGGGGGGVVVVIMTHTIKAPYGKLAYLLASEYHALEPFHSHSLAKGDVQLLKCFGVGNERSDAFIADL